MTAAEFQDLLERFGEDLSGWPVPLRDEALSLVKRDPQARAALKEAEALRNAILDVPPIKAPAGLAGRIAAMAETLPQDLPAQDLPAQDLPAQDLQVPNLPGMADGAGDGRPIDATPAESAERGRTFFARHWTLSASIALLCFVLGLGAGTLHKGTSVDYTSLYALPPILTFATG